MAPDADLSPAGRADLLADVLAALDLRDVILVANDTGGALTQLMLARRPERVCRVVLLPSDCFEYFFPPIFTPLPHLARLPGSMRVLAALLWVRAPHRRPFVFGWVAKPPVPPEFAESSLWPPGESAGVRRPHDLSVSVGTAVYPHSGTALDGLGDAADAALLHARRTGLNRVAHAGGALLTRR
jgi:pimeloyl-ACP methyl ester carboxylesterase